MQANRKQLKKLNVLKSRSDFLKMREGKKWVSHGLILQIRENGTSDTRYGLTVSRKVDKSAVRRNRIKRRLRSVVCDVLPLYARPGVDYVLIGRPQTATRPYESLCGDLKWCLKKTGFLKEDAA
ncbi:MAG: ribonuclease P protein component [Alphaproteobacteria bacterium]|nr:ribonuclease P protein component [Alphaproteobacteria bacterium]MCB9975791.1 ribonuclease P protein component [Rhodospirillales bacterium]